GVPHSGAGWGGVPGAERARQRREAVEEGVGDLLVQDEPRAGDAGLALVVEDGPGRAVHRRGEMGTVEARVAPLAAELELDLLEVAAARLHDAPARGGGAGERDLRDAFVLGD